MPGELILVFDDGYAADVEEIQPVLDDRDAVACFAVISDSIGAPPMMNADQVRMLARDGHEIAAHGRRHRYLQAFSLAVDARSGHRRVHVHGNVAPGEDHRVLPSDTYELIDSDHREMVEVTGKGEDAGTAYVELAAPLQGSFATGETLFRPTADTVLDEVAGAGEKLRDRGFDPTTFVFPYDAFDGRAWRAAEDHYRTVANASVRSLPNPPGTPSTNLRRYYLETDAMTRVDLAEYLDGVARRDGTGVLAGHSAWDSVTPERIEFVIDAARERDIEVTTFERRDE